MNVSYGKRLLPAASMLVFLASAPAYAAGDVEWGYHGDIGPEFWGSLTDDHGDLAYPLCGTGTEQSPIDIPRKVKSNRNLTPIAFDYSAVPLSIKNNGHTVQVNYAAGSSMTVNGATYSLLQFHFHIPSEHEVKGSPFPMEGHLVHARGSGDTLELAVIGVLMQEGDFNSFLQPIFDNMPAVAGTIDISGQTVDATGLLPGDRGYYAYGGSLTTPACSEGVKWHVLKSSIELSGAQIDQFGTLFLEPTEFPHGNARPVQPLNGRTIGKTD